MIKYGIIIMRAQPFHTGHMHIIDKIKEDGLQPIILLGSANESGTGKNPYDLRTRVKMIHLVYPDMTVAGIDDCASEDAWIEELSFIIKMVTDGTLNTSTIYLHEKLEDLYHFTFRGIDYSNESYCKMYELTGLHTTKLPISDIKIRAKLIRTDLEGNKKFLHPKVYKYIKGL